MVKIIRRNVVWIMLVALIIMFACMSPNFLTVSNFITIFRQVSINGILSVGLTFVLISGGIDLSIGRQMGLTSVIAALLIVEREIPVVIACTLAVMVNALVGLINGLAITYTNMPPMIETLGMQFVCYGAASLITGGFPIYGMPQSIKMLGQGFIKGVFPICVIIAVVIVAIGGFVLMRMHFGRNIFAIGSNDEAAYLSGINVELHRVLVYVISAVLAGIAGLVLMSRVNSGQPNNGDGYEMNALISCVVGGISFAGGSGSIKGLIGGIMVMGVLSNGMGVAGMSEYTQTVVKGAVLIIVVAVDSFSRLRKSAAHD